MTRIIGGTAGGRTIAVPATGTRPTSDRVREAVFSRIDHLIDLAGITVLDLFAGSGALGLEAASRGASRVVLVESAAAAARVCRANAASLGLAVEVVQAPVERFAARPARGQPTDLVLVDPPYDYPDHSLTALLIALQANGHLTAESLIVIERSSRGVRPTWPPAWRELDPRRYGETTVWFASAPVQRSTDPDSAASSPPPSGAERAAPGRAEGVG